MKKLKNLNKLFILLLCSILWSTNTHAQYWFPKSTDTLVLKNNNNNLSPLFLGIGTAFPTAQTHTTGTVRFEGLVDTKDTFVVVTDINGNISRQHIDSLLIGKISAANAWLLTGNTVVPTDYIGTNNNDDFRIRTAGAPVGRYTWDGGNCELGTTNAFNNSLITYLGGDNNISETSNDVFLYGISNICSTSVATGIIGTSNSSTGSVSVGIMGRENTVNGNSDAVVALGRGCTISNSEEGGVFGEDLNMNSSHGSFMAGGHSFINQFTGPTQYGYNMSLGAVNNIEASNNSHIYGNTGIIDGGSSNFIFGNNLQILGGVESFAFGSGISNNLNSSMKFGFNNNRTMTLAERGIGIQMAPGNPVYTPIHNLEVQAGSASGTVPEIMFQDLPVTTNPYDMVVIDPATFELYRIANCCNSGGVNSSCTVQNMVPKVNASGSTDLTCSQIFDNGTSVGIGTTAPRTFTGAGVAVIGPPALGTVSTLDVNGLTFTNTLVVSSDARLKKDVKSIDNALEKVSLLNGVTYTWENEKYKERNLDHLPQAGFLAQEVEKVYPRAVVKDKQGFYAMNYNAMIPLLSEAIKELNTKVKQQKNVEQKNMELTTKVASLEQKLSQYDQKLAQLEARLSQLCETGSCKGVSKKAVTTNTFSLQNENDVIIYPNPSSGLVNIMYGGTIQDDATVIVTSMDGKEILTTKLESKSTIDLSELAKGSYLIILNNNDKTMSKKITLK